MSSYSSLDGSPHMDGNTAVYAWETVQCDGPHGVMTPHRPSQILVLKVRYPPEGPHLRGSPSRLGLGTLGPPGGTPGDSDHFAEFRLGSLTVFGCPGADVGEAWIVLFVVLLGLGVLRDLRVKDSIHCL